MTAITLDAADRRRSLAAIIGAGFGTGMGVGAVLPLLTLLMERDGVDNLVIGLNSAMFPLAILTCGPFIPRIARRFGTLAALYVGIGIFMAVIPLYWLSPFWAWFPLRFIAGASGALYWIVSETWINLVATDENRGRVTAIYATVLTAGFTLGPFIIGAIGIDGFAPFGAALAANLLVLPPLAFARRLVPDLSGQAPMRFRRGFAAAPAIFVAVIVGGLSDLAAITLLPIYGLEGGLDREGATLLLAIFCAGNAVLQWPLGWLADRLGRYRVLVWTVAAVFVGAVLLPLAADTRGPLWLLLFVWGGAGFGIYTVALALLGEKIPPGELAAANTLFVMIYEIGSLSGPVLAGGAMDLVGRQGMPLVVALATAGFLVFAVVRRRS